MLPQVVGAPPKKASIDIWQTLKEDKEVGEWLRNVPIFRRITDEQRNKVGGAMEEQIFQAGEAVFNEGDPGDKFYVIKGGSAAVTVKTGDTPALEVARLKKGDYC